MSVPPIHFCCFGTLPEYRFSLARIKNQAEESNYFATVKLYIPQTTPGLDAHTAFIAANRRGYGYWMWKALVLLDRMIHVPEGDIVVYADTGCTIHTTPEARSQFAEYIGALLAHPAQRFAFQTSHPTAMWCKGDALDLFNARTSTKGMIMAGIQMYANTPANRAFVQQWLELMTRDGYHYVTDAPSRSPNDPTFREHRHDQALFSLLAHREGIATADHPGCVGTGAPFIISRLRHQ